MERRDEKRVAEIVPADVVVHAEPLRLRRKVWLESIRATSQRMGRRFMTCRRISRTEVVCRAALEVDETLTLREAHRQATSWKRPILSCPGIRRK